MVYKFFEKKISITNKWIGIHSENKELDEELHKPIIRTFEKRKVHSSFIDNIWGADLDDMQVLSKFCIGIRFLLCVIDISSKYAWVIHLKRLKRYCNY